MIYWDSDGRVDVNFPDRTGRPWFAYRAREGVHWRASAEKDWATTLAAFRNTGRLRPPAFPSWRFPEVPLWYQRALEPDVLLGRRGLAGWDGLPYDAGLLWAKPFPDPPPQGAPKDDYPAWLNWLHGGWDVVGFIPVFGDALEIVHAGWYLAEAVYWGSQGKSEHAAMAWIGAGASGISALPLLGDAAGKGLKYSIKAAAKWDNLGRLLVTGAKRAAVQILAGKGGGWVGQQIAGERGRFWGQIIGNVAGGLTNAALAWRAGRIRAKALYASSEGEGALMTRRSWTYGNTGRAMGRTDKFGNVTIRPGLVGEDLLQTVRHERVHQLLSPRPGLLVKIRADIRMGAYKHSHLLRYLEEAAAESWATGSLRQGLAFPLKGGLKGPYRLSLRRILLEASGYLIGTAGSAYAAYQWADGDTQ